MRIATSNLYPIEAWVPQGFPISPVLYNLYTADPPKLRDAQLSIYADDTGVYCTAVHPADIRVSLQRQLDALCDWLGMWKIKINAQKTQGMFIRRRRRFQMQPIVLEGTRIPGENSLKYLGLTLHKRLTWKTHIQNQVNRGKQAFGFLYPLLGRSSKICLQNKILLYKQIMYGGMAWNQTSATNKSKGQIIQNKILRAIVNAPWYIRNADLHRELKVDTIIELMQKQHTKFLNTITAHTNDIIQNTFYQNPQPNRPQALHKNLTTIIT